MVLQLGRQQMSGSISKGYFVQVHLLGGGGRKTKCLSGQHATWPQSTIKLVSQLIPVLHSSECRITKDCTKHHEVNVFLALAFPAIEPMESRTELLSFSKKNYSTPSYVTAYIHVYQTQNSSCLVYHSMVETITSALVQSVLPLTAKEARPCLKMENKNL